MQHRITIKKLRAISTANPYTGLVDNNQLVASINAEMMRLGFCMSAKLSQALNSWGKHKLTQLYNEVIPVLRNLKGADVNYRPMYPNFPAQVMEASLAELYWNAIVHYWSFGTWLPKYGEVKREIGFEDVKFIEIDRCSHQDFLNVFTTLVSAPVSLSEEDRGFVAWLLDNYEDDVTYPEEIPFKETLCILAAKMIEKDIPINHIVTNVTDVLRVMAYLSDGDISLASNTKFKSLPKRKRRLLIAALESLTSEKARDIDGGEAVLEDFCRHRNKWIRAFHNLHVGSYMNRYPTVAVTATALRSGVKVETFNSKVEQALERGEVLDAVFLLKTRPGDFARRMDHVLRISGSNAQDYTINAFEEVADKVSTRVLLQMGAHFEARDALKQRVAFPKGAMTKAVLLDRPTDLAYSAVDSVCAAVDNTLHQRFSKLEPLGKCWIDTALTQCPVPLQQRSASTGLVNVARGTRLPMTDKKTLRFFIYWVGRDIDLSATLHDENFNKISHISYTHLKDHTYQACHSGDIVNAPDGAAEFIDITIDDAYESGARYIVMNVYVFSGPNFADHQVCYAGWMTRDEPDSSEIFDPKTVEQKIDLRSQSRNAIPVVFDLKERKGIWCDLVTPRNVRWGGNNVESNRASIGDTLRAITSLDNKPNLYGLFLAHAVARGEVVANKEHADTVFSLGEGITPFDIDKIAAEFVA